MQNTRLIIYNILKTYPSCLSEFCSWYPPYPCRVYHVTVYHATLYHVSHLFYYISCWGGIPNYKLGKIFSIQKRCVRLLFDKEVFYDQSKFYFTYSRIRTYNQHMEHTNPLFDEHKIHNEDTNLHTKFSQIGWYLWWSIYDMSVTWLNLILVVLMLIKCFNRYKTLNYLMYCCITVVTNQRVLHKR